MTQEHKERKKEIILRKIEQDIKRCCSVNSEGRLTEWGMYLMGLLSRIRNGEVPEIDDEGYCHLGLGDFCKIIKE